MFPSYSKYISEEYDSTVNIEYLLALQCYKPIIEDAFQANIPNGNSSLPWLKFLAYYEEGPWETRSLLMVLDFDNQYKTRDSSQSFSLTNQSVQPSVQVELIL